jgi:hypothetical protein
MKFKGILIRSCHQTRNTCLHAIIASISCFLWPESGVKAQELYIFSEPASNLPAKSLSLKYAGKYQRGVMSGNTEHRQMISAQFGLDRKWMLRTGMTISNMYQPATKFESVNLGFKYRFLSRDDVHRHFRMAVYGDGSRSRNNPMFDELTTEGDQTGVQGGIILTQLLHKLAVSVNLSRVEVLHPRRWQAAHANAHPYRAHNYSVSAGYLLFPRRYANYGQTNLNLYVEMLGSRNIGKTGGFLDIAPGLQLILKSQTKVNLGYRTQVQGDVFRMSTERWLFSVETTFLNALKRKRV